MLEWIKVSSLIIDQIFNYGPKITKIFKTKEQKNKQFQLKILCNDIANEIQKSLLNDLKTVMDYSVNVPLKKENIEEINKSIQNVIDIETEKMLIKMKDIIINQFNDILIDNLLCTPKYHNLLIVGNDSIYQIINKLYNNKTTLNTEYEKFHLFSTPNAEFRPGLLLYALNIKNNLFFDKLPNDSNQKKNDDKDNKDKENNDDGTFYKNIKKISNEILAFIKNQNKMFNNSLNRKITGIMLCIDKKEDLEKFRQLIINLQKSIKKYEFELDLYFIIVNKCINMKELENKDDEDKNDIINENNNIIEEEDTLNDLKIFSFTINDENMEILDEEDENKETEKFLSELVKKYIDDYMKSNINNIHCSLSLQFEESINYYFTKLNKEFSKAVQELKNFNLKSMPLKVEFDSQIRKIVSDIFTNHIFPISNIIKTKPENNIAIKNQLSNQSLNIINDLFNYCLYIIQNLTTKAKNEYTKRLLAEVKEKINDLFTQLELDQGKKEKVDEYTALKTTFSDNITDLLNDKIEQSTDIYNLCLTYFYINQDLFKCLNEKINEFCKKNIFENKEFNDNINKRITQQMDSYQRRALNID